MFLDRGYGYQGVTARHSPYRRPLGLIVAFRSLWLRRACNWLATPSPNVSTTLRLTPLGRGGACLGNRRRRMRGRSNQRKPSANLKRKKAVARCFAATRPDFVGGPTFQAALKRSKFDGHGGILRVALSH